MEVLSPFELEVARLLVETLHLEDIFFNHCSARGSAWIPSTRWSWRWRFPKPTVFNCGRTTRRTAACSLRCEP